MIYAALGFAFAALAALIYSMRWGMKAKDEAGRAADMYREQERRADSMQFERDEWKRQHDVTAQQLNVAKVRLATSEIQRNTAYRDERAHVVEAIRNAPAAVAADIGNRILSRPLPHMPKADPASPGDGDRGAAALPAAGPTKPTP